MAGCGAVGPKLDANSEGDAVRDQALAVFIDRTGTDRLDGQGGDNTDWKYVDVVDKGRLRINVSMDSPQSLLGGEVGFYDEFGNRLERFMVTTNQSNYIFAVEVEKIPNKYFVRAFTKDGGSVYSVGATLALAAAPPPPQPFQPVVEAPPEPVAAPTPRRRTKRRARPPAAKKPPPPPPPPPAADAVPVIGRVIRSIPAADNTSVTLTVRLPSNSGVTRGTRGKLYKGGAYLGVASILKVVGRTATGLVKVAPGKVTGRLTVKFPPR
jgi:hypothetical protein